MNTCAAASAVSAAVIALATASVGTEPGVNTSAALLPPLNLVVSMTVGVLATKVSEALLPPSNLVVSIAVGEPALKVSADFEPPLNLVVSIAVGEPAVNVSAVLLGSVPAAKTRPSF